jgi:type II secretory pathway pseudopilin PulG
MQSGKVGSKGARGVAYLALLIVIALMGVGLAAVGSLWSHIQTREKEQDLLFIGNADSITKCNAVE